ncbi:hypothetical protein EDD21DRAFT_113141 [Dissophora ornata]|nr:hypothetical protein BGZ58_006630 [Dissophora ornata]KAI8601196.1 hypothetical protein EDD21DRAFT_113141 [Dissophora ornata]
MTQDDAALKNDRLSFSLMSIAFSHFNEKARWALDYYNVPYVEYRSLPVFHMISMYSHKAKTSSPGTTPFVTPFLMATPKEGESEDKITLNNSTKILGFLSEQFAAPPNSGEQHASSSSAPANLYSDDAATKEKILALEERFGTMIGPHVRRYMYYEMLLHSPASVCRGLGQHDNAGKLQTWLWVLFFPLISRMLLKVMRVSEESGVRSKEILKREFDQISRVLESGPAGPAYLVGNQFSAADLTLSSLAGLVVGITQDDGYGAWVPSVSEFRPEAQAFCEELRQTTAGKHILECYKLHRGQKAPGSSYGFKFFGLW